MGWILNNWLGWVLTRVIKLDKDVFRGLIHCALLAVDDVSGDPLCLSNVVSHAACGVNHKTEDRRAGNAHQSETEREG